MTQGKLPLTAAPSPDTARIAAIVSARHGIVIPPDDPAWAIVTMNELVLRGIANEALAAFRKLMAAHSTELRAGLLAAEKQAAQTIDAHARASAAHLRNVLRQEIAGRAKAATQGRTPRRLAYRRYLGFAAVVLAIFAYGFWMGRS